MSDALTTSTQQTGPFRDGDHVRDTTTGAKYVFRDYIATRSSRVRTKRHGGLLILPTANLERTRR